MTQGITPKARGLRRIARSPWTHLVLAFVVLALVQGLVLKLYQVPSESMEPTLTTSDRILVSRVAFATHEPAAGDIVVFNKPATWGPPPEHGALRTIASWFGDLIGFGPSNSEALVKRIVGEPGSEVACCTDTGALTVDGAPIAEPYVAFDLPFEAGVLDCTTVPASPRCFPTQTVPRDSYLVMGDNRANSSDSVVRCRSAGTTLDACARFVPRAAIVGKLVTVLFPFDQAFTAPAGP